MNSFLEKKQTLGEIMSQSQRAERRLTTKDKWLLWFNSWKPSSIKKMWHEELSNIPAKKAQVEVRLDNILRGK